MVAGNLTMRSLRVDNAFIADSRRDWYVSAAPIQRESPFILLSILVENGDNIQIIRNIFKM